MERAQVGREGDLEGRKFLDAVLVADFLLCIAVDGGDLDDASELRRCQAIVAMVVPAVMPVGGMGCGRDTLLDCTREC